MAKNFPLSRARIQPTGAAVATAFRRRLANPLWPRLSSFDDPSGQLVSEVRLDISVRCPFVPSGRGADLTGMDLAAQYLNLLELTLTGAILDDIGFAPGEHPTVADRYDPAKRMIGRDWPQHAQTMIGLTRLRHLRQCVELVLRDSVPGDFIETGVWRGGACIFMRAILFAYGVRDRRVWVADSFAGLPPPTPEQFPADTGSWLHTVEMLAVSLDDVHRNFMKYGMLDDQVVFLKGWFKDTLPNAAIERLAVLRLDGDMYESTMDALTALYHKVSECGFVIIDDYNLPPCREAVTDFRASRHIVEPIEAIDLNASFWRKSAKG